MKREDTHRWTLDVEIHPTANKDTWAQRKFLVHGFDDVLWTDDPRAAADYLCEDMIRLAYPKMPAYIKVLQAMPRHVIKKFLNGETE